MEQLSSYNNMINFILSLWWFFGLVGICYFVGRQREKAHFKSLSEREVALSYIMKSDLKTIPENWNVESSALVSGSVVIATDYFKTIASSLRNLFGGNVKSLENLVERGRREAVIRMLSEAHTLGANAVWNIRIEAFFVGGKATKPGKGNRGIEILAYGTALLAK